ncbi:MAG TPA: ribokinase [Streptosporangiaceae bacterium]|nr:ribokinase [Streptosporangiaceae bacterium]
MLNRSSADGAKTAGPVVVAGAHGQSLLLRVDAVPREGETVLAAGFEEPEDGGKATNQAVAAAKLGAPVRLVTLLGNDERGRRWRRILEGHAIDVQFLLEANGATDVGFVMLPPNRIPAIASSRDLSASLDGDAVLSVRDAFTDASVVACQLEAPQTCALESFRLARVVGAITILNPAPAATLSPELISLTDILVPNEHEAAALHGSLAEPAVMASGLARRFGCAVVVTAGPLGCFVEVPGEKGRHCPAPKVQVADTTGAGDAFIGGLAARLRAGDDLPAAAAYAATVASFSVTRHGTMPAYPTAADLAVLPADAGAGRGSGRIPAATCEPM